MNLDLEEINKLYDDLMACKRIADNARAMQVAQRLVAALGEPTTECLRRYVHAWILIWETRGNIQEAIRLQNDEILRKRVEVESTDYSDYPDVLRDDVEYFRDNLYCQAVRYDSIGETQKAIDCLCEACEFARQYGVSWDDHSQELYFELMAKLDS